MHLSARLAAAALLVAPFGLSAQTQNQGDFNRTASIVVADVRRATEELSALLQSIDAEKLPLAKQMDELETQVLRQRREAERVNRLRDNSKFDLDSLEKRVKDLGEVNRYLATLLGDHRRRFEVQLHISEVEIYKQLIDEATSAAENTTLSEAQRFEIQLKLLDAAADRIRNLIGGHRFAGSANLDGKQVDGQFALLGPVAAFASAEGAGLVELEANQSLPTVRVQPQYTAGIRDLATTGSGILPLDATLGDAHKIDLTKETLTEHIKKGGLVMIPILGIAAVALLIFIFKLFEVASVRPARAEDVRQVLALLKAGKRDEAAAFAARIKGPAGSLLQGAVAQFDADREILEETLYERIITTQPKLERLTPFIGITAATAPLLGLLGTVTGMIATFKLITVFGTGDARRLSSGISEALITTEFGLIVAIPCLILHALLTRLTKTVVNSMEQNAVTLINGISEIKDNASS